MGGVILAATIPENVQNIVPMQNLAGVIFALLTQLYTHKYSLHTFVISTVLSFKALYLGSIGIEPCYRGAIL